MIDRKKESRALQEIYKMKVNNFNNVDDSLYLIIFPKSSRKSLSMKKKLLTDYKLRPETNSFISNIVSSRKHSFS